MKLLVMDHLGILALALAFQVSAPTASFATTPGFVKVKLSCGDAEATAVAMGSGNMFETSIASHDPGPPVKEFQQVMDRCNNPSLPDYTYKAIKLDDTNNNSVNAYKYSVATYNRVSPKRKAATTIVMTMGAVLRRDTYPTNAGLDFNVHTPYQFTIPVVAGGSTSDIHVLWNDTYRIRGHLKNDVSTMVGLNTELLFSIYKVESNSYTPVVSFQTLPNPNAFSLEPGNLRFGS